MIEYVQNHLVHSCISNVINIQGRYGQKIEGNGGCRFESRQGRDSRVIFTTRTLVRNQGSIKRA